jgi:hypothetical protein
MSYRVLISNHVYILILHSLLQTEYGMFCSKIIKCQAFTVTEYNDVFLCPDDGHTYSLRNAGNSFHIDRACDQIRL